ncbi:putative glycerophosphoryl diester phosphodiesterase 1 [Rubripirellula amarantea]|uniref:Putative glycerophosphoryl diester phosphodiesterase 1 n=1 Tax=Rubripirellula amarantea TaxID=2527999 RepID=A0A5C5WXG0_9BACT|nr:glycerophosphodiester phosphodiesterase [Rubripirellula amarantea]TWT54949.1 putative glycerophosphoryl diester phosphodiesterase 1 [Rubripirellula amarantea]
MKNLTSVIVGCVVAMTGQVHSQDIVAHRGASHAAPENTLAAFELAWEEGADAIEGDFYLTADHHIVCIHDKTTERVCPQSPSLNVSQSTLSQLQSLDVGSWKAKEFWRERIPTLADVMATVPKGKRIFVEIKCGVEIVPSLKSELERSNLASEQIVIISFDEEVVKATREMMPQYKANWLTSFKRDDDELDFRPTTHVLLDTLSRSHATGLGSQFNVGALSRSLVDDIKESGFEFHVWTVDDSKDVVLAVEFSVDSITTNRPQFVRQIVNQTHVSISQDTQNQPQPVTVP